MIVAVLFDHDVIVQYRFIHVDSGVGGWDPEYGQSAGQRNGLLGAAQPGFLVIVTGMHSGLVPMRVELLDAAPPIDDTCEEIVEASCDLRGPELSLSSFEWGDTVTVERNGPHRVRLSAWDFEAGIDDERHSSDAPVRDRYLLQLWPAPVANDVIIKTTTTSAGYWHQEAQDHPDRRTTPFEQGAAEKAARDQREEQERAWQHAEHLRRWGGREPTPRLQQVERYAMTLVREHRDLVDTVAALSPTRQRTLAVDLARQACTRDDGPVDWSPALAALDAAQPLPPPFNDHAAMLTLMFGADPQFTTVATVVSPGSYPPPPRQPIHAGVTAEGAVRAATLADPLAAALSTIDAASWSSPDLNDYFAGVVERVQNLAAP